MRNARPLLRPSDEGPPTGTLHSRQAKIMLNNMIIDCLLTFIYAVLIQTNDFAIVPMVQKKQSFK